MKMKARYLKYFCILVSVFLFALGMDVHAEEQKRVLFISSYSYGWETVPQQIEGIQEAFEGEVAIEYKFMDTKNVTSDTGLQLFYESMELYMREVAPFDGIIVGDDAALIFVKEYYHELFAGIPVIFQGVNDVQLAEETSKNPLMTGVLENLSYPSTIELAIELYPNATKLVAILDNSVTGEGERKEYYSYVDQFPQLTFSEINASELSREELQAEVAALTDDTILLYVMCTEDKDRNPYSSLESGQLISSSASVPTFTIVSVGMGSGVLGGEVVSQKQMGYWAADMLKRHFAGQDIAAMRLQVDPPRQFIFDDNVLKRFGIKISDLPEGSEIFNHEENFFERNAEVIEIAFVIVAVLVCVTLLLLVDNYRKRKLTNSMRQAKDTMAQAAHFDALTGLKNRRVFMEDLEEKIACGDKMGLILFDLDGFKEINDTFGHNNGDVVLRELANRASRLEDENCSVYRLAGDEFTAIVTTRDKDVAYAYAKELQKKFRKPFVIEGQEKQLHSSMGIAMFPVDAASSKELVAAADAAMYHVKRNGKNAIEFYQNI